MRPRFHPLVAVVLIALLGLAWLDGSGGPGPDQDAMVGTWTDQAGPPGNSVRFYFVAQAVPGMPEVTAYEGHVTLVNFLGQAQANGSWGYGSWNPLTLNVSAGGKDWFVAIRKLDDDHLLVRFGTDAEEMYRPEALDHPDARVLTRTGWEPDGPFNRGPR